MLRQKEVIFLHWYHHVTVLLYCWHSYMTRSSAGLYFIAMNYGVHAIMYFYFFLMARAAMLPTKPERDAAKPKWDTFVTALQISQMVVGVVVCGAVYYFQSTSAEGCDMTESNYRAGAAMYSSYFVLFAWFAVKKYVFPQAKGAKDL